MPPKKEVKHKKPKRTRGHSTRSTKNSKKTKTTQKTTVIVHSSGGGSGGGGYIPFPPQQQYHEPIVLNNFIPANSVPSPFQTIKEKPEATSILNMKSSSAQTDAPSVASFSTQTEPEPVKVPAFKTPKTVRKPVVRVASGSDSEYEPFKDFLTQPRFPKARTPYMDLKYDSDTEPKKAPSPFRSRGLFVAHCPLNTATPRRQTPHRFWRQNTPPRRHRPYP